VNLAIATNSRLIVSRDKHLLNLMDVSRSESRDFLSRFPFLRVIEPQTLLGELNSSPERR
jgi:hypothetical protein